MGWDMREGLLGWDAEVGNARAGYSGAEAALFCLGRSVPVEGLLSTVEVRS